MPNARKKPPAKPKRALGRNPANTITEEQMVQMETLLSNHTSIKSACVLAGIDDGTYYVWMRKADEDDTNPIYGQFKERMTRARNLGKINAIQSIARAGKEDWRATAWLLERTHPDEFGPKIATEMTHKGTINHEHKSIIVHLPAVVAEGRKVKRIEATSEPAGDQQETTP